MEKNSQQPTTRLQKVIAGILAALFLITVTVFGVCGLLKDPSAVLNSVRFHKAKKFLADPEDVSFFPMTQARIASLQNQLGNTLPLEDEMSVINGSFQYAIGRDLAVQGAEQMLRLPNNQLYYITSRPTLAAEAQEIVDLYNHIDGEIPFLFSFIHPGFFNGGQQLPEGYAAVDTSDELAEEILSVIRSAGIETLDSRTFFEGTGLTSDDLILKTDKHWTYRAALLASRIYAEEINRIAGVNLDLSKLEPEQFEETTYEDLFFGDFGRLVGLHNSQLEDITVFLPKYETNLTRHSEHRHGAIEDETGPFAQSIFRERALQITEGKPWSEGAYTAYGLIEAFEQNTNHGDCEDMTLLVLRDSFSEPICSFLSLVTKNVISADLRYSDLTAVELIEKYKPDMVIVSFSRFMFEDHTYRLGLEN